MNQLEKLFNTAHDIEAKIGYTFKDRKLLALAFIHRSFVNENRAVTEHNERLEFLGDSVLGMLIADYLYHFLPPTTPEGDLSHLRSRLVDANSCMIYVQSLDIEQYLLLGKGERTNDGRGRETILADLFEAVIAAIYLDGGIDAARAFIFDNFSNQIEATLATPIRNWKALLQDYCQKKYQQPPVYSILAESGPEHSKVFQVSVWVNNQELGRGGGSSKKEAQQAAAGDAFSRIYPEHA